MGDHKWILGILQPGVEACGWIWKKKKQTVADQVSLSFQLLGAERGLYEFGRTLYLLSTVTGLGIPPHNYVAARRINLNLPALLGVLLVLTPVYSFFFFLAVDVFKQIIHPTRENTRSYSVRVSQVLFGFCPGETQTSQDWRWAMSSIYP